jgi:hypothetical protein
VLRDGVHLALRFAHPDLPCAPPPPPAQHVRELPIRLVYVMRRSKRGVAYEMDQVGMSQLSDQGERKR